MHPKRKYNIFCFNKCTLDKINVYVLLQNNFSVITYASNLLIVITAYIVLSSVQLSYSFSIIGLFNLSDFI